MTNADFSKTQPPDEAWLTMALPEEPIRPDVSLVDAHMHLWHHASGYQYFVADYARDVAASGRRVESTIYVECGSYYSREGPEDLRSIGETQFAAGMAAIAESGRYTDARIAKAIIANIDITAESGRLDEIVAAHKAAAGGRLRGVRRAAKWDADPIVASGKIAPRPFVLADPALHAGVRQLAAHNLLFEVTIFHPQIEDVIGLANAAPETQLVVNHCASPIGYGGYRGREIEVHEVWQAGMRRLAAAPNVTVKLGGLLMSLANFDFKAACRPQTSAELVSLWGNYLRETVELFGADRCMAASNFPVEKAGVPFGTIWNTFMRVFERESEAELQAICGGTARRIYRL